MAKLLPLLTGLPLFQPYISKLFRSLVSILILLFFLSFLSLMPAKSLLLKVLSNDVCCSWWCYTKLFLVLNIDKAEASFTSAFLGLVLRTRLRLPSSMISCIFFISCNVSSLSSFLLSRSSVLDWELLMTMMCFWLTLMFFAFGEPVKLLPAAFCETVMCPPCT